MHGPFLVIFQVFHDFRACGNPEIGNDTHFGKFLLIFELGRAEYIGPKSGLGKSMTSSHLTWSYHLISKGDNLHDQKTRVICTYFII